MPIHSDIPFELKKEDVIRNLGMGKSRVVLPEIERLIDELVKDATVLKLIQPSLVYNIHPLIKTIREDFFLPGDVILHGLSLQRYFSQAKFLAMAVVTIGPRIEAEISACFKRGRRLQGIVLDAIGNAGLESAISQVEGIIRPEAEKRGLELSSPLSPGNTGWALAEQFKLFELVPAEAIGVRLTQTAMMAPLKSASMLMGLGENMPIWSAHEHCDTCPQGAHCAYRLRPGSDCTMPAYSDRLPLKTA
jgi:hypothetical protein